MGCACSPGTHPCSLCSVAFPLRRQHRRRGISFAVPGDCTGQLSVGWSAEQLKEEVAGTLRRRWPVVGVVNFVDDLQNLGIAYHFKEMIQEHLDHVAESVVTHEDLFQAAQRFRVLRHNGYGVAQDVFHKFVNKQGNFNDQLRTEWRGLLGLHEASHYRAKDEEILSHAMEFSTEHLKSPKLRLTPPELLYINDVLQHPRHMKTERLQAWRFIHRRKRLSTISSSLLKLALLDYNDVQSKYREELREFTKWWKQLDLENKLPFARERPQECFLWAAGIFPDPSLSFCRAELAKTVCMLLLIDDLYDNYGSLEELSLFTDAVRRFADPSGTDCLSNLVVDINNSPDLLAWTFSTSRWEPDAVELPDIIKICYLTLYNVTNDIGSKILVTHGNFATSHLKSTIVELCEAFLLEAKWFYRGTVPSVEEYLKNAVTSSGTLLAAMHIFFLLGCPVSEERLRLVKTRNGLFSLSGRILRLWNDLGTSKVEQERGDVASVIQCHAREKGLTSECDARSHIKGMIRTTWRDLNGVAINPSPLPFSFVNAAFNLARASQSIYHHGDDPMAPSVKEVIQVMLMKPIQLGNTLIHA